MNDEPLPTFKQLLSAFLFDLLFYEMFSYLLNEMLSVVIQKLD